jgi:uncharacterized protein (DUF983 family)
MLGRGARRRCPWCAGRGAWFTGWFRKEPHCRTCGLRWDRRQDGFELGALIIATMITGGAVMAWIIVGIVMTYPNIAVVPLVSGGMGVAFVVPLATYPFTHTVWSAVDLAVHPPEDHELREAQAVRASRTNRS